jgi:membrane dipeptidase
MSSSRRDFLGLGLSLSTGGLLSTTVPALAAGMNKTTSPFIDGLGFPGGIAIEEGQPLLPLELEHIARSGLAATHLTIQPVATMPSLQAFEKALRDIARWDRDIAAHPDMLHKVMQVQDIDTNVPTTGLIYGLQDGVLFEDDLGRLDALQQFGIRVIQPTYNRRNLLGDGCMEPANAGLSRTGREAIVRMNQLGILVDLSHCGRQTVADAIEVSTRPVSFTHTGCDALAPHPRHRSDAEIRAVADTGGITGIFIMPYLAKGKQPTAAHVIKHLEHALKVGGEDHVAIGSDGSISPTEVTDEFRNKFREITRDRKEKGIAAPYETETGYLFASDLNMPERFSVLADTLQKRGHPSRVIEKVLGGNLYRLFAESWSPGSAAR